MIVFEGMIYRPRNYLAINPVILKLCLDKTTFATTRNSIVIIDRNSKLWIARKLKTYMVLYSTRGVFFAPKPQITLKISRVTGFQLRIFITFKVLQKSRLRRIFSSRWSKFLVNKFCSQRWEKGHLRIDYEILRRVKRNAREKKKKKAPTLGGLSRSANTPLIIRRPAISSRAKRFFFFKNGRCTRFQILRVFYLSSERIWGLEAGPFFFFLDDCIFSSFCAMVVLLNSFWVKNSWLDDEFFEIFIVYRLFFFFF